MDNILERQRAAHEEIERLEQAIVDEYMQEAKTHRERLRSEHTVDRYLTRIADRSKQLCESYEDKEGLRQSEIEALTGSTEFSEFYERLRVIKDHHRKFPNEPAEPPELEFMKHKGEDEYVEEEEEDELEKLFTGEESYGRYLDLNALYTEYINLKGVKKLDYLQYLNAFDNFEATYPKSIKNSPEYRRYLKNLRDYLRSFFRRARPLYDLDRLESQARKEFEEKWANGTLAGWEDVAKSDPALFCEACQKTFTKQTVYDGHLKGKKHINNQKKLDEQKGAQATNGLENGNGNNNGNGKEDTRKNTAWKELLISKYTDVLSEFRDATRANVERKQALTDKERTLEQEQEEIEIGDQDTDEEDDDKIYNPLKLPLGWDGKPIPYWLYKLHGLGVEYPCEICGNYVYMGRKAFDKHFQEWRHAHGMRCLGIPNTRHFHEITKIEDAYALYEKLKKEGAAEDFIADQMEEYEDEEGNVFNKKTYEDLRRQGIL